MEKRRQPEVIAGRVNADGSIAAGDGFTVTKGTVGSYALVFPSGFRVFTATASSSAQLLIAHITTVAGNTANVAIINTSAAGIDSLFSFIAVGVQQ